MTGPNYDGMLEVLARELGDRDLHTQHGDTRLYVHGADAKVEVWVGAYVGSLAYFWQHEGEEHVVPVARIRTAAKMIAEQLGAPRR